MKTSPRVNILTADEAARREKVRRLTWAAIRRGEITRVEACQRCGARPVEPHHRDPTYTDHLDVEWLCDSCHHRHGHPGAAQAKALEIIGGWKGLSGPSFADLARALGVSPQRAGRIVRELAKRRQLTVVAGEKWGDPVTLRVATP